jgi:hypothetical protein
LLSVLNPDEM